MSSNTGFRLGEYDDYPTRFLHLHQKSTTLRAPSPPSSKTSATGLTGTLALRSKSKRPLQTRDYNTDTGYLEARTSDSSEYASETETCTDRGGDGNCGPSVLSATALPSSSTDVLALQISQRMEFLRYEFGGGWDIRRDFGGYQGFGLHTPPPAPPPSPPPAPPPSPPPMRANAQPQTWSAMNPSPNHFAYNDCAKGLPSRLVSTSPVYDIDDSADPKAFLRRPIVFPSEAKPVHPTSSVPSPGQTLGQANCLTETRDEGIGLVCPSRQDTEYSVSTNEDESDEESTIGPEDGWAAILVDKLMDIFARKYYPGLDRLFENNANREHGNGDHSTDGSSQNSRNTSSESASCESSMFASSVSSFSGQKHARYNGDDGDDYQDEDDPSQRKRSKLLESGCEGNAKKRFACPFFKRKPARYISQRMCPGPGWESVHRLKGHLYSCHLLFLCDRCGDTFKSDILLREHHRMTTPCNMRDYIMPDGIDPVKKELLRSRKKSNSKAPDTTEHGKWIGVYRILFPDDNPENTPSPYYETPSEAITSQQWSPSAAFEDFLRHDLPVHVRQEVALEIEGEFEPLEEPLRLRLPAIVQAVFERFQARVSTGIPLAQVESESTTGCYTGDSSPVPNLPSSHSVLARDDSIFTLGQTLVADDFLAASTGTEPFSDFDQHRLWSNSPWGGFNGMINDLFAPIERKDWDLVPLCTEKGVLAKAQGLA